MSDDTKNARKALQQEKARKKVRYRGDIGEI